MVDNLLWLKWLKEEMETELQKIPKGIITMAKRNPDGRHVVLQHICRKLCFNQNDKQIQTIFSEILKNA
jgi:hypothetical protein